MGSIYSCLSYPVGAFTCSEKGLPGTMKYVISCTLVAKSRCYRQLMCFVCSSVMGFRRSILPHVRGTVALVGSCQRRFDLLHNSRGEISTITRLCISPVRKNSRLKKRNLKIPRPAFHCVNMQKWLKKIIFATRFLKFAVSLNAELYWRKYIFRNRHIFCVEFHSGKQFISLVHWWHFKVFRWVDQSVVLVVKNSLSFWEIDVPPCKASWQNKCLKWQICMPFTCY